MIDETISLLDGAIAEYLRADGNGQPMRRDELLARYPQLAEELQEFFADRERFERVACLPPTAPAPNKYFDDYELLEEIARGGMGVVYKARQTSLDRTVAIKMVVSGPWASDEDVSRFRAEAESVARLRHPNVVAIHDVGEHQGRHYFSMDYVQGPNLAAMIRERPLPPRRAAAYVKQAAEAIAFAHQQGVLHRDLKPSNILVDAADQVRITDFGLAGCADADGSLTRSGQILGTPSYMPPEQAEGKRGLVGPQSDVYSLGAMLYELLVGRPPFRTDSAVETLRQVVHCEPAAPRSLNAGLPKDLETICLKCLQKRPHRRYLTSLALADDLGRFLEDSSIHARPVGRLERVARWSRRNPAMAMMSAAVLVLTIAVALVVRSLLPGFRETAVAERLPGSNPASTVPTALAPNPTHTLTPLRQLQAHRGGAVRLAVSPDGELMATAGDEDSPGMVELWQIQTGRLFCQLAGHRNQITALQFSVDGKRLASGGKDGELRLWNVDDRSSRRFGDVEGRPIRGLAFTPDSEEVLAGFGGAGGKYIRSWNTSDGVSKHEWDAASVRSLALSPSGGRLAIGYNWTDDDRSLELLPWPPSDLATPADRIALAAHPFGTAAVAFSPDGTLLATGGGDQKVVVWSAETGRRLRVLSGHTRRIQTLAFNADSSLLATAADGWTGTDAPGELRIWEPRSGCLLASADQPDGASAVAILRLDTLLTADRAGGLTLWRLAANDAARDTAVPTEPPPKLGERIDPRGKPIDGAEAWLRQLASQDLPGTKRLRNPHNGHVYQRIDHLGFTWHEAQRLCELLGGHLATITSAEENEFVVEHFTVGRVVWLGATDEEHEGQWKWVTGESFEYKNWPRREPSGWMEEYRDEHYLMTGADLYPGEDGETTGLGFARRWNDIAYHGCYENVPLLRPLCEWDRASDVPATHSGGAEIHTSATADWHPQSIRPAAALAQQQIDTETDLAAEAPKPGRQSAETP